MTEEKGTVTISIKEFDQLRENRKLFNKVKKDQATFFFTENYGSGFIFALNEDEYIAEKVCSEVNALRESKDYQIERLKNENELLKKKIDNMTSKNIRIKPTGKTVKKGYFFGLFTRTKH